jgi:hypothetical protein
MPFDLFNRAALAAIFGDRRYGRWQLAGAARAAAVRSAAVDKYDGQRIMLLQTSKQYLKRERSIAFPRTRSSRTFASLRGTAADYQSAAIQ